jgi:hypothetical protein
MAGRSRFAIFSSVILQSLRFISFRHAASNVAASPVARTNGASAASISAVVPGGVGLHAAVAGML